MYNKYDIDDKNILMKIGTLKSMGLSEPVITQKINEEFGKNYPVHVIRKAQKIYAVRGSELIAADESVKAVIREAILDIASSLKEINEVARGILHSPKNEDKLGAINAILKQLEFSVQYQLQRFENAFDVNHLSKIEYTKIFVSNLKELEKVGHIKIYSMPGEAIDVEAYYKDEDEFIDESNKETNSAIINSCAEIKKGE